MITDDIFRQPVRVVAAKLRSGEFTSVELTRAMLHRAKQENEKTNAYISFREKEALAEAQQADELLQKGEDRGLYHGIPMGIKDNIFLKGEVTTMGSEIHRNFVPEEDAEIVVRLREAGVVIIGKLNLHEYAWGVTNDNPHFGPTRNPWNPTKITGGSSGGSGAAIATGVSFGSVGTDTAGSVRIPASCCGVTGLKPTQDRLSRKGVFPLSESLDHVGVMGKTVDDTAVLYELLADFASAEDAEKRFSLPKGESAVLTIGINEEYYFHHVDAQVEDLVRQQIDRLEEEGARLVPVQIPTLEQVAFIGYMTILTESFAAHDKNLKARLEDFGPDIQALYQMGVPAESDYKKAQQIAKRLKAEFRAAFLGVDALITPTLPCLPPDIGSPVVTINGKEEDLNDHIMRFMFPGNVTGLPSLSVPCGLAEGLPVGIQVIGPAHGEAMILEIGRRIENHVGFDFIP